MLTYALGEERMNELGENKWAEPHQEKEMTRVILEYIYTLVRNTLSF